MVEKIFAVDESKWQKKQTGGVGCDDPMPIPLLLSLKEVSHHNMLSKISCQHFCIFELYHSCIITE